MKHSQELKKVILQDLLENLPGESAHYKLAPFKRKEEEQFALKRNLNPKKSAVMLILYPNSDGDTSIPFILRNNGGGVHSGQVALPGGKVEKDDLNDRFTAIRETHEEISVAIIEEQIIGALTPLYVPVSNFIIQPYVAWLDHEPIFIPEPSEVQFIIQTPLSHLINPMNQAEKSIEAGNGYTLVAPGIHLKEHFLWGATAMLVSEFLTLPSWSKFDV